MRDARGWWRRTWRLTLPVLHATKGLELPSLNRLSEVIGRRAGARPGRRGRRCPVRRTPKKSVAGCPPRRSSRVGDARVAAAFQELLHGPTFRVYTSTDVVGVELCGALKNVIALATGASDGLGYGDNTRAALITRSLVEIGRLVQAAGGDPRTVAGLAGLGDVVATCTSRHSRNRWAGEQIGAGRLPCRRSSPARRRSSRASPPRGRPSSSARRYGVDLPVCTQVDQVLNHGAPVRDVTVAPDGAAKRPSRLD